MNPSHIVAMPTLPFEPKAHQPLAEEKEGLIGKVNFSIIILSIDYKIMTYFMK